MIEVAERLEKLADSWVVPIDAQADMRYAALELRRLQKTFENASQAHEVLIKYLAEKVKERDWHGVSGAANDLRVLEAKMEVSNGS